MKSSNLLLAATAAALLAVSASAQLVTANMSDLILGFNKSSGTGSTSNLEVNLGAISSFQTGGSYATGSEVFLTQLSVADLNATYGTGAGNLGWKSSATKWAVVGTNGAGGSNTLWVTQASLVDTPSAEQGAGANTIAALYPDLTNRPATANSGAATVVSTADVNSWANLSSGNFNFLQKEDERLNSGLASGPSVSLNLYELVQGAQATTLLGTFKLYADGGFSYTLAAIPEPSTYAALLGVMTLGIVAYRRRRQVAVQL